MARETKAQKAERAEGVAQLRKILKPGDKVYTIVRNVARSGMSRDIDVYVIQDGEARWIAPYVARAIGYRMSKDRGIRVRGCGMDMCFHLVYSLSHALFGEGFGCIGVGPDGYTDRCPSNDHSNGDRDYTPHGTGQPIVCGSGKVGENRREHWHTDGGYALQQRNL